MDFTVWANPMIFININSYFKG
uniref:Uncharacterized protein n=1 Tax=Tetranychus urticae TaxID=32264 RepID=T1JWR7_TETUR